MWNQPLESEKAERFLLVACRRACVDEKTGRNRPVSICGAKGIRTPDPLHAMEMRYQLRHSPKFNYRLLFEPIDNLPQVGMKTKLGVSYSLRHPRHPSHPPKVPSEDG